MAIPGYHPGRVGQSSESGPSPHCTCTQPSPLPWIGRSTWTLDWTGLDTQTFLELTSSSSSSSTSLCLILSLHLNYLQANWISRLLLTRRKGKKESVLFLPKSAPLNSNLNHPSEEHPPDPSSLPSNCPRLLTFLTSSPPSKRHPSSTPTNASLANTIAHRWYHQ